MGAFGTTRMSSKGQVVIPEDIRRELGLEQGDQFVVVGDKDKVILKTLRRPDMSQFDALIREARRQARAAGLRRTDVATAVRRARGRR